MRQSDYQNQAESNSLNKLQSYREQLTGSFYAATLPFIVAEWNTLPMPPAIDDDEDRSYYNVVFQEYTADTISIKRRRTTKDRKSYFASISNRLLEKLSKFQLSTGTELDEKEEEPRKEDNIGSQISQSSMDMKLSDRDFDCYADVYPWVFLNPIKRYHAKITFKNGAIYEGGILNKKFDGTGNYRWTDGSCYEGEFTNGKATGWGTLSYKDLSVFKGHVRNCILHGLGCFIPVGEDLQYSGQWCNGYPHGKGWLLYGPTNYYNGEWQMGIQAGFGTRKYANGGIYAGMWMDGRPNGEGCMLLKNQDLYRGEWKDGVPHGYGEYTWKAVVNDGMVMTLENQYLGGWNGGKRDGFGVQVFGMDGSRVATTFKNDIKDGPGIIICGDGTTVENKPLFQNDIPVHRGTYRKSKGIFALPTRSRTSIDKKIMKGLSITHLSNTQSGKIGSKFSKYEPLCWPLMMPFYGTPTSLSLEYHITQLQNDLLKQFPLNAKDETPWNASEVQMKVIDAANIRLLDFDEEVRILKKMLSFHHEYLRQLYKKYSTLDALVGCGCDKFGKPVMSRLFLHQFLRDIEIDKFNLPLVTVDKLLSNVPDIQVENPFNPFEKIYFWQFTHCLLVLAFKKNSKKEFYQKYHKIGIYHNMFNCFLEEVVKPNDGKFCGRVLFGYKDLLPITAVYKLYLKLGEPLPVRELLKATTKRLDEHLRCIMKQFKVYQAHASKHYVVAGNHIVFIPLKKQQPGEKQEMLKQLNPYIDDPFYNDLKVFHILGPKKVLNAIARICPLLKEDKGLISINYDISFLEFYEILYELADDLVELKNSKKETEPEMIVEEEVPQRKSKRTSKKKN